MLSQSAAVMLNIFLIAGVNFMLCKYNRAVLPEEIHWGKCACVC